MNEITITEKEQEYELMKLQSGAFFRSSMFPDIKSHEQALVKVMVGKEMGINPFQSLTGIHMVNGKPEISARLMSSLIARHPDYFYRVTKATDTVCEIDFYDKGNLASDKNHKIGTSIFTIAEAAQAGLANKDNWKKYPSDMLFARALSRGARRMAAGAFFGVPVYIEGELDNNRVLEHDSLMHIPLDVSPKIEEIKATPTERDGIIPKKSPPVMSFIIEEKQKELDVAFNAIRPPVPGSDEAIIEEIKQTHAISEGGF